MISGQSRHLAADSISAITVLESSHPIRQPRAGYLSFSFSRIGWKPEFDTSPTQPPKRPSHHYPM